MTLRAWLRRAPLLGFFGLTFAWSWACWALSPAIRAQLSWLAMRLMFAGSLGPSLAAIVVVASTRTFVGLRAYGTAVCTVPWSPMSSTSRSFPMCSGPA